MGETTLVAQVLDRLDIPTVVVSADEHAVGGTASLAAQWDRARIIAADASKEAAAFPWTSS